MAIPSDALYSGSQGTCNWYVTKDKKLVIEPKSGSSGQLTNAFGAFPWASQFSPSDISKSFTSAEVKSGVTYQDGSGILVLGDSSHMFSNCSNMESITAPSAFWNSIPITDWMFYGCSALTSITFNGATFSNTISMEYMFSGCSSLASLDLSTFNTNNVTDMSHIFSSCDQLSTVTFGANWKVPSNAEYIDLTPCTNTSTGIYCGDDADYLGLTDSEKRGTWRRFTWKSFSAKAERTAGGKTDEDGSDATITVNYAVGGTGTYNTTLNIYVKQSTDSTYPSTPDITRTLTERSGTVSVTISEIGDYAYDFRVEWIDNDTTSVAFPSVATNIHLVDIDLDGNVTVLGDISCANIKCGQITGQNVATNSYKDYSVTFDSPFSDVPIVVVGFLSSSTGANMGRVSVSAHTVTADGFYARVFNSDTVARSPYIYWIATTSGIQ